jgi:eukaryotic-like serine/threonine-protein kinase
MALYAAVAKRRRGELMGGDEGQALVQQADDWMRGEQIKNPQGMATMLAPGRWSR